MKSQLPPGHAAREKRPAAIQFPAAEQSPEKTDHDEVDAVLEEFYGDARLAISALLHDLTVLSDGCSNVVSLGFVRGNVPSGTPAVRKLPR